MMKENIQEDMEPVNWVPQVILGGKGPPEDPNNPDWLSSLEVHTTVLIQGKRDTSFNLGQATVIMKKGKGVLLGIEQKLTWVDPVRFCRDYKLYEVLQTAKEAEEEALINQG